MKNINIRHTAYVMGDVLFSEPSKRRRGSEWEILEGLREGQRYENKPQVFTGYLHKKRKWPLKGWHKVISKNIILLDVIFNWMRL